MFAATEFPAVTRASQYECDTGCLSGLLTFFSLTVSSIDNRLYQSCVDVVADIDALDFWSGKLG